MNEEQTLKAIEVMQAFAEGKSVEFRRKGEHIWRVLEGRLASWNWDAIEYRIKEPTKPSINWDHVHPDYNLMATDADGEAFLYKKEPTAGYHRWEEGHHWVEACSFKSFIPGDCDWKESLVQRPESV
jgi:hypothetical protein